MSEINYEEYSNYNQGQNDKLIHNNSDYLKHDNISQNSVGDYYYNRGLTSNTYALTNPNSEGLSSKYVNFTEDKQSNNQVYQQNNPSENKSDENFVSITENNVNSNYNFNSNQLNINKDNKENNSKNNSNNFNNYINKQLQSYSPYQYKVVPNINENTQKSSTHRTNNQNISQTINKLSKPKNHSIHNSKQIEKTNENNTFNNSNTDPYSKQVSQIKGELEALKNLEKKYIEIMHKYEKVCNQFDSLKIDKDILEKENRFQADMHKKIMFDLQSEIDTLNYSLHEK